MAALSTTLTVVEAEPQRPATHRFLHSRNCRARRGRDGQVQLCFGRSEWTADDYLGRGQWIATDYPNAALTDQHLFMPLAPAVATAGAKP